MNKKFSNQTKEKAIQDFLEGKTITSIVKKYKISRTTAYTWTSDYRSSKKDPVDMKKYKELQRQFERSKLLLSILQEAPFVKKATVDEKMEYVESRSDSGITINTLCEAIVLPKGTYYNRKFRSAPEKKWYEKRQDRLLPVISEIYNSTNQIFGAGKIAAIMKANGFKVSERVVANIMHENGMFSIRGSSKTLYLRNKALKENLLNQQFNVNKPNEVWVSDVTFFKYFEKTYYVCVILDLYARKIVSYKISTNNSTQLTKRTLKSACETRKYDETLLFHSDQGSNYTSRTFMDYLRKLHIKQSFSRKGTPYDNSVCESFFASLKREELYRYDYKTEAELYRRLKNYMEFYNEKRPHSMLNYQTPNGFEKLYRKYHPESIIESEHVQY